MGQEEGKAEGGSADVPVFVVHVVAVSRSVDNVKAQPHTILNNDYGYVEVSSAAPENGSTHRERRGESPSSA